MSRRNRRPSSTNAETGYLRYLKPGALAQLRDSRISAKSLRFVSLPQIHLHRTPSLLSFPARSPDGGQAQIGNMENFPCFSGRIFGQQCPQRKKVVASKSVFFLSSIPSSPAPDLPDPAVDLFSSDILVAH